MDSGSIFNWGPNLFYTGATFKMKLIYNCISENLGNTLLLYVYGFMPKWNGVGRSDGINLVIDIKMSKISPWGFFILH